MENPKKRDKIAFVVNDTDFFLSHRKTLAQDCMEDYDVVIILPKNKANKKVIDLGFRVVEYPLQKTGTNPFIDLFTVYRIFRILRKEKPQLVHNFTIKPSLYGSLASRWAGVPYIFVTITGLGFIYTNEGKKSKALQPMVDSLYRLAMETPKVRVIFQNPDDKKLFINKNFLPEDRTMVVPGSGVDPQRFFPIEGSKDPNEIKILVPCRMLYDKGIKESVEAFKKISKDLNIKLLLAGKVPKNNPNAVSEKDLQTWSQDPKIEWLGFVSDMNQLYNKADIVCLPSYREGLPLSLLEASLCQCAIVTSDVPGCNFLIRDKVNGLLVPAKDSIKLAETLKKLVTDKNLRDQLAKNARDITLGSYTYKSINEKIISEYRNQMSN